MPAPTTQLDTFVESQPTVLSTWRSIILFGRNVASYKFALGKSLLESAQTGKTFLTLEELAPSFAQHVCTHLELTDKQGTSPGSAFLDACRRYNAGTITKDELIGTTVRLGFTNVIDAFHVVNQEEVAYRFFVDERRTRQGILLTDELLKLPETTQFANLPQEVEARWRLVETAWSLGMVPRLLVVKQESDSTLLVVETAGGRRTTVTSARDALSGYQKGKCFYCFAEISIESGSQNLADVDHFFPWSLGNLGLAEAVNLDGVWNLVLSCNRCNRGTEGKFARVPTIRLLERLHRRNQFLIQSHHPLRETLIAQMGSTETDRRRFLQGMDQAAIDRLLHRWEPVEENEAAF